jgi:hypothetical protein
MSDGHGARAGLWPTPHTYCGVFTPRKTCNIETQSRDYALVDEAVFSPCRAEDSRPEPNRAEPLLPGNSYKHFDNARVRKNHVTAPAVTSRVSNDTTMKVFSRMSDPRVYRNPQ